MTGLHHENNQPVQSSSCAHRLQMLGTGWAWRPMVPAKVARHHIHHAHLEYAASAVPAIGTRTCLSYVTPQTWVIH